MKTLKWKSLSIILIILLITITAISAENISDLNNTVQNTHNSDINDTGYINQHDYYYDENGTRIPYTSDTGSFNNVTMSNGYNAYAIQDGGYIETNDSKTHPSFWNDSFYVVDANDTQTVVGHWYYANKTPIGEYLKIFFFKYYDKLNKLNAYNPNIPNSIYVQSMVWDLYKNGDDTEKLGYRYTKEAVNLFNSGYRVNNTGNIEWLNETAYRIFDFSGFKNLDQTHKDLWGLKVQLFITENTGNDPVNETNTTENNQTETNTTENNQTETNTTENNQTETNTTETNTTGNATIPLKKNNDLNIRTGNPIYILIILLTLILIITYKKS